MASKWLKKESKTRPGQHYYMNTETKVSTWAKPKDYQENVCVVRPSIPTKPPPEMVFVPMRASKGGAVTKPKISSRTMRRTGLFEKIIGLPGAQHVPTKDPALAFSSQVQSKYSSKGVDQNLNSKDTFLERAGNYAELLSPQTVPQTVTQPKKNAETSNMSRTAQASYVPKTDKTYSLSKTAHRNVPKSAQPTVPYVPKTANHTVTRLPQVSQVSSRAPPSCSSGSDRTDHSHHAPKRSRRSPSTAISHPPGECSSHTPQDAQSVGRSSGSMSIIPGQSSVSPGPDLVSDCQARVYSWLDQLPDSDPCQGKSAINNLNEEVDMEVDERVNTDIFELRSGGDVLRNAGGETLQLLGSEMECAHMTTLQQELYLVLDTNVLLQNLKLIDSFKDELLLPGYARPILVIPWVVVQELDALKDSKHRSVALSTLLKASHAVQYVNNLLRNKHPRLQCQKPAEDREMMSLNNDPNVVNDDRVLMCSVLWKTKRPTAEIVLLTQDRNLESKALIQQIDCCSLQDFNEWVNKTRGKRAVEASLDFGSASRKRKMSCDGSTDSDTKKMEALLCDDLMSVMKITMRDSISVLIQGCMEEIYTNQWLDVVFKKPPWSFMDTLLCLEKHYVAVFRYLYKPDMKEKLKEFLRQIRQREKEVSTFTNVRKGSCLVKIGKELIEILANNPRFGSEEFGKTCIVLNAILDMAQKYLMKHITINEGVTTIQGLFQKVSDTQAGGSLYDVLPNAEESVAGDSVAPFHQDVDADGDVLFAPEDSSTDVIDRVKRAFQECWDCIVHSRSHLSKHLTPDVRQSDVNQRQQRVFEFRELMANLWPLKLSYEAMLQQQDLVPESMHLQDLAKALNDFAKFSRIQMWQPVTGPQLFIFHQQERQTLAVGVGQLNQFVSELETLFNSLLPSEQTCIKEVL